MKKLSLILCMVLLLTACSDAKDPLAAYRGQSAGDLYQSAERNLSKGNYSTAVREFEALDNLYPFGHYAEQAQLDVIYAYYQDDDMSSALAAAERYIHLYPRGAHVDYAYYMKGLINFQEGLTWLQRWVGVQSAEQNAQHLQDAYRSFNELVSYFPNSLYREDALLHMAYIRNGLAKQEINIAEFYMYHKAYVAAANRATYVIQHYSESPSVVTALGINVKAYRALKLDELANKNLELLRVNYPDSSVYKKLK